MTHNELSAGASSAAPGARVIAITNFTGAPEYDALINELVETRK